MRYPLLTARGLVSIPRTVMIGELHHRCGQFRTTQPGARATPASSSASYAFSDRWEGRLARHARRAQGISCIKQHAQLRRQKIAKQAPQQIVNAELAWTSGRLACGAQVMRLGPYWMNDANTVLCGLNSVFNLRAGWARGAWELWGKLMQPHRP